MYSTVTLDHWWYKITYPKKRTKRDIIIFNLWDSTREKLIKKITLNLNDDEWLSRIQKASTHYNHGVELCSVHIERKKSTNNFNIYFGKKIDGLFKIS